MVDLGKYAKAWCLPEPLPADADDELPQELYRAGLDFAVERQLERLERWRQPEYQDLFRALRANPRINQGEKRDAIENGFYPTPDAECYAAMIFDARPDQIIEVGSGYSTRVARATLETVGLKARLRVIDPEPRTEVAEDADEVIRAPVEHLPLEQLGLTERTILFIDSSHVCRARGDIPYLFCRVLPDAPKDLLVHIHDVYIPYEYPPAYDHWLWNEQYVLFALLSHSTKFEIVLTTYLLSRLHTAAMRTAISPAIAKTESTGGCFWIRSAAN